MKIIRSLVIGVLLIGAAAAVSNWILTKKESLGTTYASKKGFNTPAQTLIVPTNAPIKVPLVLDVPNTLSFCDENVPLNRPDIRERLEKELYITAHRYYQVVFYLKRGPRVLDFIANELRKAGVPEDLMYLAVIESDLIPTIRSPKGAKGIWQFMPATARRYGLQVDRYVDERMNLEKATSAAIRYLKDAHDRTGNWTLAAAAYNMGVARTKRTIETQKVRDYYQMHINEETSRYVFRILAAKLILENPQKYGYQIPDSEIYQKETVKTVTVNNGIRDLVDWSKDKGITYYDLKRLNPWIINTRLPKGKYEIEIPRNAMNG